MSISIATMGMFTPQYGTSSSSSSTGGGGGGGGYIQPPRRKPQVQVSKVKYHNIGSKQVTVIGIREN
jgi:hypothetical protein